MKKPYKGRKFFSIPYYNCEKQSKTELKRRKNGNIKLSDDQDRDIKNGERRTEYQHKIEELTTWEQEYTNSTINQKWEKYKNTPIEAAATSIYGGKKMCFSQRTMWWNEEVIEEISMKTYIH